MVNSVKVLSAAGWCFIQAGLKVVQHFLKITFKLTYTRNASLIKATEGFQVSADQFKVIYGW